MQKVEKNVVNIYKEREREREREREEKNMKVWS